LGAEEDVEIDAAKITEEIRQAAQESITEEDLRIRVENILRVRLCDPLGVPWARYERRTVVSGLHSDALYGNVILEYEKPHTFDIRSGFDRAINQLKGYIKEEAERGRVSLNRFFGVALDGFKIGFVRYSLRLKNWDVQGPIEVNTFSVLKLLEAIRGLARKPLDADLLIKDLGPGSKVAKNVVNVFYNRIVNPKSRRSKMLFDDWRRVFSQVCAYSPDKIAGLEEVYGIEKDGINYEALLFAVHSYYALVMKLLAAEVAVLFGGFFLKSYTGKLENAYLRGTDQLREELRELEEGGIFVNLGIENFLEADYFAWYLDEWDDDVAGAIIDVVRKLSEYEPGTAELEPDVIRDLFKRLYQNLVPKKIRHDLGEYYTPDWLAELLLNEVGFTVENFEKLAQKKGVEAPLDLRLLDPACGSGTFLVLAIKRVKDYAREHFLEEKALGRIVKNIVGFDLNPLAVMASRANYLLALGELIRVATVPIELPVYFADSILVERKSTLTGEEYVLKTAVGVFSVPISVVEKGVLGKTLSLIEKCVHNNYSQKEFKDRALKELNVLTENEVSKLANLFTQILRLEKAGKNKIWTRVLKNSFAPLFVGKFDYVVGNPPWISWDNLPEEYRNASKSLWFRYGLFSLKGMAARLGGGKKDISALFTYVCADRYLKDNGMFGFLITQAVFKTKGAGEGFRRFKLGDKPLRILKVHDMVELAPFEGANNRSTAFIMKKGEKTTYPIPYIVWNKIRGKTIEPTMTLDEIYENTARTIMEAIPADPKKITSTWLTSKKGNILRKITGASYYHGYLGVNSGGANAVYRVKPLQVISTEEKIITIPYHLHKIFQTLNLKTEREKTKILVRHVLVENIQEGAKKKVDKVREVIEDFFIFPLLRSKDIRKWKIIGYTYTLQMQDPVKRTGYDESWVKINFPKTYSYLRKFKKLLEERAAYKKYFNNKTDSFFSMFNVGEYTFAPYKVVWSRMGARLEAVVVSSIEDQFIGKKLLLPQDVLAFIPSYNEAEAHFICAFLNSLLANLILQSLAKGTKSFGTPKFLKDYLKIPKFDPENKVHAGLAELSKEAHERAKKDDKEKLIEIENEIDVYVAKLYGLSQKDFDEIKTQSST